MCDTIQVKEKIELNKVWMHNMEELQRLVEKFSKNIAYYKDNKKSYNEQSCRVEYIDPFLKILGWDVSNSNGLDPQYREVIAENYSNETDRPDYSLTIRGVVKFFLEAKKPAHEITKTKQSSFQARKYGWNAKHKISVLTNFENLVIYDTTIIPKENDNCNIAAYRTYHYSEYVEKFDEIYFLLSKESVYSGTFDKLLEEMTKTPNRHRRQVDEQFLDQINRWRILLSNHLYSKDKKYQSQDLLNDVVQGFINQIVFLRTCEDKNLPLYHRLSETIKNPEILQSNLEELLKLADKKYNSGIFSGKYIVFDLNNDVIKEIVEELYYPKSPYLFNIIEPNLLGKIYEMFLTEQLTLLDDGTIGLTKKKDCVDRSLVTTPIEIVKYIVEKTLSRICEGKSPSDILSIRVLDMACGSGVFLEEAFEYLQSYCIGWYLRNNKKHLMETGTRQYKLPFKEKRKILCSCIFGIDIDMRAVEITKFSLLIKLIENETAPSIVDEVPVLPNLKNNICYGNSLIGSKELEGFDINNETYLQIVPIDWEDVFGKVQFDVIIGNPPYVNTEGMHELLSESEFEIYKERYFSAYKQFDKYFIFIERAIKNVKKSGMISFIVPNKFFKIESGKKLRKLISKEKILVSLVDFGSAQLFDDKSIYSSIILLQKSTQERFDYSCVDSATKLWSGENIDTISLKEDIINDKPWILTADVDLSNVIHKLDSTAVPLSKHAKIFNGIQTSAERPIPIYWFSKDQIYSEDKNIIQIKINATIYSIEKAILKPFFKPTKKDEKGLNSYSIIPTDKFIIFPYDDEGKLISIDIMENQFPGTFEYLKANYDRLVPKSISGIGKRDVSDATLDTWYKYGRTQALTAFVNTQKLIVGILSKEPMYAFDNKNMLIASGGTAGYCAVAKKESSPYEIEYIQAWLSNPYTEKILRITGSDFEGGFKARGTNTLSTLPFIELDLNNQKQKNVYDLIIKKTREIYKTNEILSKQLSKSEKVTLERKKSKLIKEIEESIDRVYKSEF